MIRQPRFELVRSDAGHFARFIASNGKELWRTSETYTRRKGAERAILLICGCRAFYLSPHQDWPEVEWGGNVLEVREADQRVWP